MREGMGGDPTLIPKLHKYLDKSLFLGTILQNKKPHHFTIPSGARENCELPEFLGRPNCEYHYLLSKAMFVHAVCTLHVLDCCSLLSNNTVSTKSGAPMPIYPALILHQLKTSFLFNIFFKNYLL